MTLFKAHPYLLTMDVIKVPESNYLNHPHFKLGLKTALLWPLICYLVSWYFWNIYPEHFEITHEIIFKAHQWWRLPLGVLIHGDFNHFLSNSLFLSILSFFIARTFGAKILFGVGIIMGVITHLITLFFMEDHIGLVGASGMLYAFWGLWFSLYFLIDRFNNIHRKVMKIFAISLLLLIPQNFEPHVSYLAHFIGFIVGITFGVIVYYSKRSLILSYEKYKYILDPPPRINQLEAEIGEYWKEN